MLCENCNRHFLDSIRSDIRSRMSEPMGRVLLMARGGGHIINAAVMSARAKRPSLGGGSVGVLLC